MTTAAPQPMEDTMTSSAQNRNRLNATPFGGTFLNYASVVRSYLVEDGRWIGEDWFKTQMGRVIRAYDLGESTEMLAETLGMFAEGAAHKPHKTPRELAVRVVRL